MALTYFNGFQSRSAFPKAWLRFAPGPRSGSQLINLRGQGSAVSSPVWSGAKPDRNRFLYISSSKIASGGDVFSYFYVTFSGFGWRGRYNRTVDPWLRDVHVFWWFSFTCRMHYRDDFGTSGRISTKYHTRFFISTLDKHTNCSGIQVRSFVQSQIFEWVNAVASSM